MTAARPTTAAALVMLACGCATGPSETAPSDRLQRVLRAAGEEDVHAVPALVEQLDADDPAIRLAAIGALQRLTGLTMGYDPFAGPRVREPAVQRWVDAVKTGAVPADAGSKRDG